jgi:uncharacterized protein YndB with AHSA1/START domain
LHVQVEAGVKDDQRIERRVMLPAGPEAVWEALTDGEQLSLWFGCRVEIEPPPGGRITAFETHRIRRAVVESVEPPSRLSFRWLPEPHGPGWPPPPRTRVEITLEEAPKGTVLTVVESPLWGLAETDDRSLVLGAPR